MCEYEPPFTMTDEINHLVYDIVEQVGRVSVLSTGLANPHLRKENRIRTIHSSLAIEHNSLSLEQVTAILNGKRILGNPNEIKEVTNAYDAYEMMLSLNPFSQKDLLHAHRIMMQGLIQGNGTFRRGGVGVFDGEHLVHMAPPAQFVAPHIENLMKWYQKSTLHPLIKSAIFHYEFEFIHPFSDGNGRMGRMWHSLLLGQWRDLFYWLPVEELIRSRQQEYYEALGQSDRTGQSTPFVAFMLQIIYDSIKNISVVGAVENSKAPKRQIGVLDGGLEIAKEKILNAMKKDNAITQKAIADETGIPKRTVQRVVKALQIEGVLERVGGKRYGHWHVKS